MTCKAEERALAEIRKAKRDAELYMQQEKALAELELFRSDARIDDWGAVRLATALMVTWDKRRVQAEGALARCKERAKQHD